MIEMDYSSIHTLNDLKIAAQKFGSAICNDTYLFPLGINANFVVRDKKSSGSLLVCTFERNLGDDPQKSVTQACGTGSTFVCSEIMRKMDTSRCVAACLGGQLVVEKNRESLYLSGEVFRYT